MTAARGLHAGAQLRLVGGSRLLLQLRLRGTRGAPWPLTLKPKTAPPAARTVDLMHPHSPATGRFTSSVSRGSTTFTARLLAEHMRCSAASASAAASSGVLTGPQSAKRGSQHEITDAKRHARRWHLMPLMERLLLRRDCAHCMAAWGWAHAAAGIMFILACSGLRSFVRKY